MENLNPCLCLLSHVRVNLERGHSVKVGIVEYLRSQEDEFSAEVLKWWNLWQQGLETTPITHRQKSVYRKALLEVLERGLRGESILVFLESLEKEVIKACEHSLQESLGRLPFLLLVPLLLFQLPAFLVLLFGPILVEFLAALGGNPQ